MVWLCWPEGRSHALESGHGDEETRVRDYLIGFI